MKLLLNNRVYESDDRNYINHLLNETRDIFVQREQFAIYALEQKTYIEFTKYVFPNKRELLKYVTQFTKKGFKVHFYAKEKTK